MLVVPERRGEGVAGLQGRKRPDGKSTRAWLSEVTMLAIVAEG